VTVCDIGHTHLLHDQDRYSASGHAHAPLSHAHSRSPAHQNKIASESGIEAIVAGMKAHPSRLNVSQQGALALGDLAWSNTAVQQRIGQCSGVQVRSGWVVREDGWW
jgi:hypothetical protein